MDHMQRRAFLKAGLASGVLAVGGGAGREASAARPAMKDISKPGVMPVRAFGKTGHSFPVLASGGASWGDNHEDAYGVWHGGFDKRVEMVRLAYEKGVRYFDTARIYGDSEKVTGEALRDVQDDVYINSKVLVGSPRHVRRSVEQSLEQLGMDRIDCMQLHGPMIERLPMEDLFAIVDELETMRDEGLFRFIGLTGHSRFEKMLQLIESGRLDTLLIQHGYIRKGFNTLHSQAQLEYQEMCLSKAHELDMGICAMKVMGAVVFGHNAKNLVPGVEAETREKLPGAAIRWALEDERLDLLVIGLSLPEDLDRNIAILNGALTCTNEDRMLLARFAQKAYESEVISSMRVV